MVLFSQGTLQPTNDKKIIRKILLQKHNLGFEKSKVQVNIPNPTDNLRSLYLLRSFSRLYWKESKRGEKKV